MKSIVESIRAGIVSAADSLDQAQSTATRVPAFTYVPPTHARALDVDATVVEGIRGAGKSFWWALLASAKHRDFIRENFPEVDLPEKLEVKQGFGNGLTINQAPDSETLEVLVSRYKPRSIWRAVIAVNAGFGGGFGKVSGWRDRTAWVEENPEDYARLLEETDSVLKRANKTLLILFDALDRLADDWSHIQPLAKGLLQVALEMRSTKRIRCKVYLRSDILQDEKIVGFPDFSKLLAVKASLEWRRADLYALLYQCIGNSLEGGAAFQALVSKFLKIRIINNTKSWRVPMRLRVDESLQEQVFELIAGRAMGSSTKRGKPYTWLVNHLQDGMDQVSPRSYFAALGTAAAETPADSHLSIDYRGIQRGVQRASQIRVQEITEDYAWVKFVMDPLRGNLTVPCLIQEIIDIWKDESTLGFLVNRLAKQSISSKLPPQRLDMGGQGVLLDLQDLGMLRHIDKKKIQMPDVYRVAFGLGRKGGIKPLK